MAGVGGIQSTGTAGLASSGTGGGKPWYTFAFDNPAGAIEPFGGGPKPDSNVQLPADYPVTALLPGTVTNIDTTAPWGCAITIKLDQPVNAIATHTAYLHLAGVDRSIQVGQHLNAGDIIGRNGGTNACGAQKVPLGFALYNGDHYGFGSSWNAYVGDPRLNPYPLLQQFASGQKNLPPASNQGTAQDIANYQSPGAPANQGCDTPIVGWFICNLPQFLVRAALFIVGLVFLIIGGIILIHPDPASMLKKAVVP